MPGDNSELKRKAREWISAKAEIKHLSTEATQLRKRLKLIETDLVQIMCDQTTEEVEVDGKVVRRARGLCEKKE